MTTPSTDASRVLPVEVLRAVTVSRESARVAEVATMVAALEWADMHPAESILDAATVPGTDRAVAIAGEGAPLVAEFAMVELATALGRSADSTRLWLGAVMEIRFRLPKLWHSLVHGSLEPWRARQVAAATIALPRAGAAWVDAQVASVAHRIGPAQLDRTVAEAVRRFDPDQAYEDSIKAAERRHVTLHEQGIVGGTVELTAVLDVADARDLKAAVGKVAHELLLAGSVGSEDVRHAQALGEIARHELALDLGATSAGRDGTLYVHVDGAELMAAIDGTDVGLQSVATVENGGYAIDLDRMREWLSVRGSRVTIRPVLDLARPEGIRGYEPSDRLREQVVVRDATCVFPYCGRSARRADLDHIDPHGSGGETRSDNLAPLCRLHHRAKTHGSWSYTMLMPGEFLWSNPRVGSFHVDQVGTSSLDPPGHMSRP